MVRVGSNSLPLPQQLQEKMAKYQNECGCSHGAVSMTLAFGISLSYFLAHDPLISTQFLLHLPLILLISMGAAGIGKLGGILYGKYRFKQLSTQLHTYLINLKMEEPEYAGNLEEN